ncbi:hypothetical protein ACOMHN_054295 [Nucella lapillus]
MTMMEHIGRWFLLACCIVAVTSAAPDTVLRFLSHKEVVRMEQEAGQTHNDITVESSGYPEAQPIEKTKLSPISHALNLKDVICPGGQSICPDGSTCCKMTTGIWGCCPHPKAVCCSDHIHCCPHNMKCNLSAGACDGNSSQSLSRKIPAVPRALNLKDVNCPGGQSICPDGITCCKMTTGIWGCCPIPKAVCCSDHIHCCPHNMKCNLSAGACDGNSSQSLSRKIPAVPRALNLKDVICPGGQSICPDGSTCCKMTTGIWGCCPHPKAVCCSDHIHCCPHNMKCNLSAGACDGNSSQSLSRKMPAVPRALNLKDVNCPGGQSICPDGSTCCKMTTGIWGCCPHPKAVCCSDHIHCCPHNMKCNLSAGACDGNSSQSLSRKIPAVPRQKGTSVICPDDSTCPDITTCCKDVAGGYACCPYKQAVCCRDKIHCCPNGFTCNVAAKTCTMRDISIPWMEKKSSMPRENVTSVTCPDDSTCPDKTTCCKDVAGGYACCPYKQAVCCSDKIHCCPNGFTCNVAAKTCTMRDISISWMEKKSSMPRENVTSVTCPDDSTCPDKTTCCKDVAGGYACCPYKQAVCCSDKIHCCPNGFTCNVAAKTCTMRDISIPWMEKKSGMPRENVTSVTCPDDSTCPDKTTCCKDVAGGYACCPYKQAVCCSDKIHCCPNGFTCNVAAKTCTMRDISIPWMEKKSSMPRENVTSVTCPDDSTCPDKTTCCKDVAGGYACCPYKQAVCCSDKIHCCPNGFTCNVAAKTCTMRDISIPWMEKKSGMPRENVTSVTCPDDSTCPDKTTCCKDVAGGYACCPYKQAVCCSDKIHCCPNGFTCNVAAKTCTMRDISIPWMEKKSGMPRENVTSVTCPDDSTCPDKTTCCKDVAGGYACCPYKQAVCCSDKIHCCPNGFTCNVAAKTCTMRDISIPWMEKKSSMPRENVTSVTCPDDSTCPDKTTCCKDVSGGYACCPYKQAVCCSDKIHCCPNGFTCNVAAKTCTMRDISIPWMEKKSSMPRENVTSVTCPDDSTCPDKTTCCKDVAGGYACCPYKQAVCCSDKIHCCPNGFTCNVAAKTCTMRDISIPWMEKKSSMPRENVTSVTCPDDSTCPDKTTCCKDVAGGYACCPYKQAVCCSDKIHCCPNGFTCNVAAKTCTMRDISIPWMEKKSDMPRENVTSVTCPDDSTCPDKTTCCKDVAGGYACCPYKQAVCCSDKIHCCPNGFTCNVAAKTCTMRDISIPWMEKKSSMPRKNVTSVTCPDDSTCPDKTTCCKDVAGGYACCPYKQAVCCSDKIHCCPNGFTCNVAAKTCTMRDISIPWMEKKSSMPRKNVTSVTCPDDSTCPDKTTCCKDVAGGYACCPYKQAVCCSDKIHCCPNGFTCNVAAKTCTMRDISIPWMEKKSSMPRENVTSVTCPDDSTCPDKTTCCKDVAGGYACCPYKQAVCCSDKIHCCPNGFTCNVAAKTCTMRDISIPWMEKKSSMPRENVTSVTCPDDSTCPDKTTCCKDVAGGYACCPYKQAVCCSDKIHCCPNGFTCNVAAKTCTMRDISISWMEKNSSMPRLP